MRKQAQIFVKEAVTRSRLQSIAFAGLLTVLLFTAPVFGQQAA